MSTKIGDGTIIDPVPNLFELDTMLRIYIEQARAAARHQIGIHFARIATELHDERLCGLTEGKVVDACRDTYYTFREKTKAALRAETRDPEFDYGAEIYLRTATSGRLLAVILAEMPFYKNLWREQPGVTEYAYWNNVDHPATITETGWREREVDWNEIGPEPKRNGFIRSIAGLYDLPDDIVDYQHREEQAGLMPHLDERLEHLADCFMHRDPRQPLPKDAQSIGRWVREYKNFLASDYGVEKIAFHKERLRPIILGTSPFVD